MAGRLQDKVAIVTGAGSRGAGVGNGKAASLLFAREGAKVCLVDNVLARAQETLAEIEKEGGTAFAIDGDVSKDADCKHIVDACVMRFGKVDILHNNVGIDPGVVSVVDVDEKTWDEVMNVNVKSMMFMSKHAIPVMAANGGGAILTVSSISALRPRGLTPYTTSKQAVIGLTQAMAVDHAPQGIRVNCIAPGRSAAPSGRRQRRCAPKAPPGTSAGRPSTSPQTRRAGSRARCWSWMAAPHSSALRGKHRVQGHGGRFDRRFPPGTPSASTGRGQGVGFVNREP
jgi:NAD(P)-dependent dehydrogenase (short-subunit alcohol dehydrogenase family)